MNYYIECKLYGCKCEYYMWDIFEKKMGDYYFFSFMPCYWMHINLQFCPKIGLETDVTSDCMKNFEMFLEIFSLNTYYHKNIRYVHTS